MAKKLKKDTKEVLLNNYPQDPIRPDIKREIVTHTQIKRRIIIASIILLSILAYFLCTSPTVNHCF
jgi:archaellum biogenesis protein FlaJ (TadC family)